MKLALGGIAGTGPLSSCLRHGVDTANHPQKGPLHLARSPGALTLGMKSLHAPARRPSYFDRRRFSCFTCSWADSGRAGVLAASASDGAIRGNSVPKYPGVGAQECECHTLLTQRVTTNSF